MVQDHSVLHGRLGVVTHVSRNNWFTVIFDGEPHIFKRTQLVPEGVSGAPAAPKLGARVKTKVQAAPATQGARGTVLNGVELADFLDPLDARRGLST